MSRTRADGSSGESPGPRRVLKLLLRPDGVLKSPLSQVHEVGRSADGLLASRKAAILCRSVAWPNEISLGSKLFAAGLSVAGNPEFVMFRRFYLGRRTEDDKRQISRWKGVAGLKGRWKNALCNKIIASGDITKHVDNPQISPVIRQTLLHWAYHLTFEDLEQHAKRHK